AGPTNGRPCRSSELPGCSPTNMTVDVGFPSPKTVCVAVFHRWQALHPAAASCSLFTVGFGGISGWAVPSSGVAMRESEALAAPTASQPASTTPVPATPSSAPAAAPAGVIASTEGEKPGVKIDITELERASGGTVSLKFVLSNSSDKDYGMSGEHLADRETSS